jgi:hypothetical protein
LNKDASDIEDWVRKLREESANIGFEDRYTKVKKLGNGKFSTVYQC